MRPIKYIALLCSIVMLTVPVSVATKASETYQSELTGLQISTDLKNIRPIAVMIDNEEKALPHSSVAEADIVYEMMNSTANDHITRLMCLYKNWPNIEQIGSVRSVRSTNIPIAAEYNAILIHEGGPKIYIDNTLNQNAWIDDLDGGFSRLKNGKALEFTEFVLKGEVEEHAKAAGVSLTYNSYKPERDQHFVFPKKNIVPIGEAAAEIDMTTAYPHTQSKLIYNASTKTYDYYAYGYIQKDYGTDKVISFKDVIIQIAPMTVLDPNGYLAYDVLKTGKGFYCTNGKYMPITWKKDTVTDITHYFDKEGEELLMNPGKIYINIYPESYEKELIIK